MAKDSSNGILHTAFAEVNSNTPKIVTQTAKKYGPERARKQKIAIALSKARKAGASLPNARLSNGGRTF